MKQHPLDLGTKVELRGNIGQIVEKSDKSLTIYCTPKGRVPYRISASIQKFREEGKVL
jgi:hypothetical protein